MSFLIHDALAAGPAPAAGGLGSLVGMLPLALFFVIAYFLLMRPQQKRVKEHRALLESLKKGDEVVTSGGLAGRITAVSDSFVDLEIAPGTEVKLQRFAVQSVLPKGTLKS